jgi:hypothetical protein
MFNQATSNQGRDRVSAAQLATMPRMRDPWNPSAADLREWAYDAESREPVQDFDLAVAWTQHEKILLQCASDDRCPKQSFFLGVLYLIVGDAVRTNYRSMKRPILAGLIAHGDEFPVAAVQSWQQRSRHLMDHPDEFRYDDWCAGGLANAPCDS